MPKMSRSGNLALTNPYHDPSALLPVDLIRMVEHSIDLVLSPAAVTLERARLFFMEEPATLQDPDILLVVVYVALGRVWRRARTLRAVHDDFQKVIEQTQYRRLTASQASAMREREKVMDIPRRPGTASMFTDDDCDGVAWT